MAFGWLSWEEGNAVDRGIASCLHASSCPSLQPEVKISIHSQFGMPNNRVLFAGCIYELEYVTAKQELLTCPVTRPLVLLRN
jgi:hypothetical protein